MIGFAQRSTNFKNHWSRLSTPSGERGPMEEQLRVSNTKQPLRNMYCLLLFWRDFTAAPKRTSRRPLVEKAVPVQLGRNRFGSQAFSSTSDTWYNEVVTCLRGSHVSSPKGVLNAALPKQADRSQYQRFDIFAISVRSFCLSSKGGSKLNRTLNYHSTSYSTSNGPLQMGAPQERYVNFFGKEILVAVHHLSGSNALILASDKVKLRLAWSSEFW